MAVPLVGLLSLPTELRLEVLGYLLPPVLKPACVPYLSPQVLALTHLCPLIRADTYYLLRTYSLDQHFTSSLNFLAFLVGLKRHQAWSVNNGCQPSELPPLRTITIPLFYGADIVTMYRASYRSGYRANNQDALIGAWSTNILAFIPDSVRVINLDVTPAPG